MRLAHQLAFTWSKLTTEPLEQGVKYIHWHWHRFGVFIVNFEHNPRLVLVHLLLTLNMLVSAG